MKNKSLFVARSKTHKFAASLLGLILFNSSLSMATPTSLTQCEAHAIKAVMGHIESAGKTEYYDHDGLHVINCQLASNNRAILCEVNADKGNGAATDSYLAVLNLSCNYTFRVELIGEE